LQNPLVSIIIPTYNRVHLIGETLDSVLAQTYKNWECIVVDDGSSDYTEKIMEFYFERDNRISFIKRPPERKKNASTCRNIGLENSKGEFIQFLDSDDLISSNKITDQIQILSESSENEIAICKFASFRENISTSRIQNKISLYRDFSDPLELLNEFGRCRAFFTPHVYLVSRNLVNKSGYWNEYLDLNDDGEFFSRVISNAQGVKYSINSIAFYRQGNNSNLSAYNDIGKVYRGILSWKLIEAQLQIRYNGKQNLYVKQAKETIYPVINRNFRALINKNSFFFREQISKEKGWFFLKILKKFLANLKYKK
jgi:glycosyltransferase involved in cell wall biosynthesis